MLVTLMALGQCSSIADAAGEVTHVFDANCAFNPAIAFEDPDGLATDAHGDIYVANYGDGTGLQGRIDIFNPNCEFLTEIPDPNGPRSIAVDSKGDVYAADMPGIPIEAPFNMDGSVAVYRPEPGAYPPTAASDYASPESVGAAAFAVAVDQSNDHYYLATENGVAEYEPNGSLVGRIGEGLLAEGVDVWSESHDVYTSLGSGSEGKVRVFDGTTHALKETIDSSKAPANGFDFFRAYLAVDPVGGDVYVGDLGNRAVEQFSATGEYISSLEHSLSNAEPSDIAVDAPYSTQAGYDSPKPGYVYVTSGRSESSSHVYAFKPRIVAPPAIKAQQAGEITATTATLTAEVNPGSKDTHYHFEYGSSSCSTGPCASSPVPDADVGSGGSFVVVTQAISGLQPATAYHFRLVAENCEEGQSGEECTAEGEGPEAVEGTFTTYPPPIAGLPDQRGYELVASGNGGRIPTAAAFGISGTSFDSRLAAPSGESVVFGTEGGGLPGTEGAGFHDTYRAVRTASGWRVFTTSPSGAQAAEAYPGGVSADNDYVAWLVAGEKGSLTGPGGEFVDYLRGPDGGFGLIGRGSLATDPTVNLYWISAGAGHVIFETTDQNHQALRLEPGAPPTGTTAVYDRTADGAGHVVSLKPNDITPSAGEDATFEGVSVDGSAVIFSLEEGSGTTMYERRDNASTVPIVNEEATFAGVSGDGRRVFYMTGAANAEGIVESGEIFVCEPGADGCGPGANAATAIGSGAESTIVNISADGSHLYFVSPRRLDGAMGTLGAPNLYVWDGSSVRFIGTLEQSDIDGEEVGFLRYEGLGLWTYATNPRRQSAFAGLANDPSRTTPDGSALVFQSRAPLTAYDNNGRVEIYRYDAMDHGITCVSCIPTQGIAASDARLRTLRDPSRLLEALPPLAQVAHIDNVTEDGRAVFFQSDEALVPGDQDGTTDVYEWEAAGAYGGVGSCQRAEGCLYLISSGHSAGPNYLYSMTPNGHDVFIETGDTLTGEDVDGGVLSIYDARIDGGFAESPPAPGACQGDACQGALGAASPPPAPASADVDSSGNVRRHSRRCAAHRGHNSHGGSSRTSHCKHKSRHHGHRRRRADR